MSTTNPRFRPPRSAYLHVPFCRHRCGYCSFTVVAGRSDLIDDYLQAVEQELAWLDQPSGIDTLFFGGGTPSYLSEAEFERLVAIVLERLRLNAGAEFTVEANPSDLTRAKIRHFNEMGVTRVSLGAQSFDPGKLTVLERDHDGLQVEHTVSMLQDAGIDVSLDLIFAVPGESLESWQADLRAAIRLYPQHLSTYGLTYERGARFWGRLARRELQPVGGEQEAEMFEVAIDAFTSAGFEHYEVSNFSLPGHACRHNQTYWSGGTYYGTGPGAASHVRGQRRVNHRSTTTYLKRVLAGESPVAESEFLSPREAASERLVFGIRQLAGVDVDRFSEETGFSIDDLTGNAVHQLVEIGLLQHDGRRLRVTHEGLLLCDSIAERLLAECALVGTAKREGVE